MEPPLVTQLEGTSIMQSVWLQIVEQIKSKIMYCKTNAKEVVPWTSLRGEQSNKYLSENVFFKI